MQVLASKERVRLALAHQESDRVPIGEMGIDFPIIERILGHETFYRAQGKERMAIWAGKRDEVVRSQKEDLIELVLALGWDIVPVWITYSDQIDYSPKRFLSEDHLKWEDFEGRIWQAPNANADALCIDQSDISIQFIKEILKDPPILNESQLELVSFVVRELGDTHFIIGRGWHAPSTWTDGSFPIPGEGLSIPMHKFLLMLYDSPDSLHAILNAYTNRAIDYGNILIDAGVDAIQINADYGINTGPWLSPKQFKEFILPYMQRQVEAYKRRGVYVLKHSDGNTWPLLDMFMRTGIDGLHGIQPSVGMDIRRLKERYGSQMSLFGAVEAETLINGQPEDIVAEVEYCLRYGASGGGFVLTSSNSVPVGTQYENYMTMLETAREKGGYPLSFKPDEIGLESKKC